ncbi:MAG: hypothetical protein RLZZ333_2056, partial [Bacteroidota bacterium]
AWEYVSMYHWLDWGRNLLKREQRVKLIGTH